MKTKTHAGLAPALALRRFAAVAAVLLAFCLVFMMPVGAAGVTCTNGTACTYHAAVVGGEHYDDLQEAITKAAPSETVTLLKDVTVDEWIMFSETLSIGSGQIITLQINGLTIDGNGKTLTVKAIESATNGNQLFYDATNLNIKDLTIKCVDNAANQGGIGLTSGTISKVVFEGGGIAVYPGTGDITISGCTFKTNSQAIYYEGEGGRDKLVVTGNTFDLPENANAIILRGNEQFTDNTVISGRSVNVASGSPTVSGNNFNNVRFKVYNSATAKISGNTINNLEFNDESEVMSTFVGNTLSAEAKTVLTNAGLKAEYTITVTVTPAEYGTASASSKTAEENTEITLTATAKDGYVFKGWTMSNNIVVIGDNKFTMPASNVEITAVFEEKKEEPVTPPTKVEPSIKAEVSEDGKTITPSTGTTAEAFTEEEMEEIPIDAKNIVGIYNEENPFVVLVVTEATVEDGKVTLSEKSEILAVYPVISSAVDSESEDTEEAVSVVVLIGMDKPDSESLPSFSGEFKNEVAEAVESVSDKDYKPLSMITATDKVGDINRNLADEKEAIGIAFTISNDLYQKYKGKFVALHVKDGKVADTIQVTATQNNTGDWDLEIFGDSFSSYVLAIDNTPKPVGSSGSATDTGSGNYQYYPRDVPASGIISFGTSKVVTGMELPAGSDGTVTLNIKPTFAMPENGYYAFEIDAPGYNLDAKINGGLSFQIPVKSEAKRS